MPSGVRRAPRAELRPVLGGHRSSSGGRVHFDGAAAVDALTHKAMASFRSLNLRVGEAWCLINVSGLTHTEARPL